MLEVAVLYGCDLSLVFTPIILRLYQPHSLCEKGATRAAAKAALYVFLLTPLREGRPARPANTGRWSNFYSRPYARGDTRSHPWEVLLLIFLLAPLSEGRPAVEGFMRYNRIISTSAPKRGATPSAVMVRESLAYFYSRPYARGDGATAALNWGMLTFLLAPLREGRRSACSRQRCELCYFYSRPYTRGDLTRCARLTERRYFYSRPYTRGDDCITSANTPPLSFLLAPLHEGRQQFSQNHKLIYMINC